MWKVKPYRPASFRSGISPGVRARAFEDGAGPAGGGHRGDEGAAGGAGAGGVAVAGEGEGAGGARGQVLGGEAGDGPVVDVHQRQAELRHHAEHVDRGQAGAPDALPDLERRDAGDDAVAHPVDEGLREAVLEAAHLVVDRPHAVLV